MTLRKAAFFLPLILTLTALQITPLSSAWADPEYDRVEGSTLYFKDGGKSIPLKTGVPEPRFIALQKHEESNLFYALFSGRACEKCGVEQVGIFLMRIDGKGKSFQFTYPGRIVDPKKGQTVYEGRTFYGNCLPKQKQGIVTHQKEIVDRRRGMQMSVLTAVPGSNTVEELLIERRLPALRTTLDLVKRKVCFEIPGKNRTVLRKPLDLTPRKGLDDDEEEEDLNDVKNGPAPDAEAAPTEETPQTGT